MDYREEMVEHPDYLRVTCFGRWSENTSTAMWRTVAERLIQSTHKCALIDDRNLTVELNPVDDYEHANLVVDLLRDCARRVALVDEITEETRFFETVCVNRGLNLRLFGDDETALAWLLTSSDQMQRD